MKYADTSRYEILYDLAEGEYNAPEVGGIRTRTVRAGDTIEVECYPLTRIGQAARVEAVKRRHQRAAQEQANRKRAEKQIRRLIEHNFTTSSYVLTLTWDYGQIDRFRMSEAEADRLWESLGLPIDEEDARVALRNFYRRVRTRMRGLGQEPRSLKYLYVLEMTHQSRGPYTHYHFHMVIDAPGLTDRDLAELWPHGSTRCNRLSFRDEGPARLGSYLTKQHTTEEVQTDGRRRRRWDHSKNLQTPPQTVSDRKISRRRAAAIAQDVRQFGREMFERIYPGYRCVEEPVVRYSDFAAGAYISARLRRINDAPPWERARRRGKRT